MNRINQLDSALTDLFKDLDATAHSLQFEVVAELPDGDFQALRKIQGIYLIEIWVDPEHQAGCEAWLSAFKAKWTSEEFNHFVPSCQKGRMSKHTALKEWMPVYIGKSKNIAHRVNEHLNLEAEKSTSALKLRSRRLIDGNRLRLSVIRLDIHNYDVLATKIESALRKKHHPIVGKQ